MKLRSMRSKSDKRHFLSSQTGRRLDLEAALRGTVGDINFICKDGKIVEFHSDILVHISPLYRRIIRENHQGNLWISKDSKMYFSLDYEEKLVADVFNSLYTKQSFNVDNMTEISELLEAFGIDDSNFVVDRKKVDDEDSQIVDVISTMIEDYNIQETSVNDIAEMLMTSFNDADDFLKNIELPEDKPESSDENLLSEPNDNLEGDKKSAESKEEISKPVKRRKMNLTTFVILIKCLVFITLYMLILGSHVHFMKL